MTVMTKKWQKAAQNLQSQTGKNKTKNRAGKMTATDFAVDLDDLFNDLTNRQFQGIVDRCNTQVRKESVRLLKQGSTANRIGRSQYNKRTRGDWKNPKTIKSGYKNAGTNYLEGGWWGETLDKRGAEKPSMAYNGGSATGRAASRGDRGIISKTIPQRGGGRRGIIGPRYGTGQTRTIANTATTTHTSWRKVAPTRVGARVQSRFLLDLSWGQPESKQCQRTQRSSTADLKIGVKASESYTTSHCSP